MQSIIMAHGRFKFIAGSIPIIAGLISFLLGLVVISGWYSHQPVLIQILPQFVAMQFNTALGFVCSGLALIYIFQKNPYLAALSSILALLIGALTGFQYLSGIDLYIDQLFMDHYITTKTSHPGRMAPNTALCFVISGIGMLISVTVKDFQRRNWVMSILGSIVLGLGLIAVFGYVFALPTAYGWMSYTRMAIHTASGFSILGIGMIFMARKDIFIAMEMKDQSSYLWPISGVIFTFFFAYLLSRALEVNDSDLVNLEVTPILKLASEVVLIFGLIMGVLLGITLWLNRSLSLRAVEAETLAQRLRKEETALKESKQRYQRAIAGTNDGIWELNLKNNYIFYSPRVAEILGYGPDELLPDREAFRTLYHPDDKEKVLTNIQDHLQYDKPCDFEFRIRKKNGEYIWLQAKGNSVRNQDGQHTYMAGSITDISERKLNQDKLREAKEEAEFANLTKSEFLASMSHELRTPLNAVLGFAQMLQYNPREELSAKQNEYVENILTGGNHLLNLINEILDLSQIEADQATIFLEEVDAGEVIKNCVVQISPLAAERKLKVVNRIKTDSNDLLRTDQMRLEQIIINLLSNAVKYNRDGGTITIDCQQTKTGFLHISVADTGTGISDKDHANIFNMFQRLGSNSEIAQEGTGIGLSICKLLTEQLGGRIDFESEKGEGSTFWIELPLASNKEILIWSDNLRVGVDAIDKDHQVIIALNNKISSSFCDQENLNDIIMELIKYAQYHFRREEAIMEVCDYPELKEHRELHQKLVAKVNRLAEDWSKNNDPEMQHQLCHFLREWWMGHIMKVDVDIAQYAKGKSQEIRLILKNLK